MMTSFLPPLIIIEKEPENIFEKTKYIRAHEREEEQKKINNIIIIYNNNICVKGVTHFKVH